jgi:DNA-binding MarR family transcriptional regulator
MQDPLVTFPGYALRRAAHATAAELAGRLAPLGLRQSDVSLLMLVEANPGTTSSALGRQLDIQRANMVPILKRLEDAGLIERAPIDGKSQGLALTGEGRARLAEGRGVIEAFERELIGRVPAQHRPHLLPALNAIWR